MTWNWKYFLMGWLLASAVIYVRKIGKEREPISATDGAFGVLEYAFLIGIVAWGWPA